VRWEQEFPEGVVLTRRGEIVSLLPSHVAEGIVQRSHGEG
jgi:hypothetical protein